MLDEATTGGSVPTPHCNWCSAELPSDHETVCPSCGATLLGDGDTSVPGLTAIDAEAILRGARAAKAKPRSRLLGWISGEYDDEASGTTAAPGSLAPPPADVRREMLRLELQAQVANAQAEVESMAADEAVEHGRRLARPADIEAADDEAADTEVAAADEEAADTEVAAAAADTQVAAAGEAVEPVLAPTTDDVPDDEAPPA